ncbi:hypothetical protein QBC47DRAFT_315170 [Echria macrotheca]|uniref:Glycosyltransferase n=1 Tax=Echria macrotheca TaxID=438768 RepID=A0AAJ0FFG5_9PEZI|nr:hypothetical protein QBC47DRAFT_315170 [Echria macrotheca]
MAKVLFLTNSDFGQANVVLAVAHALLVRRGPDVEIHIASFGSLRDPVSKTSEFALRTSGKLGTRQIIFHEIDGISWGPAAWRPEVGYVEINDQVPNFSNALRAVLGISAVMLPWRPEEFLDIYRQLEGIISKVKPDVAVADVLLTPATTLCHYLSLNWVVLAPNTIKDFALPSQPGLAMLWKYPLTCSALPFPLPWSSIPRNIVLCLAAGYGLLTSTRVKNTTRILGQNVDPSIQLITANELGVLRPAPPGLKVLCAISPDLDYPVRVLPPNLEPCGPIVRAVPSLGADEPLNKWLLRRPTIYINLGTHMKASPEEGVEMALALRDVLDHAASSTSALANDEQGEPQILWKLGRKTSRPGEKIERDVFDGEWRGVLDVLTRDMDHDRVRITDWVEAEPKSILESGGVVCSISHGGANSFYEALCAGIPQVLLPAWADCYDFGNRVEMLGIGRWANKQAKPRWMRSELAGCIVDVLFGPEAALIKRRAVELAKRHPEASGRDRAAEKIMALAGSTRSTVDNCETE